MQPSLLKAEYTQLRQSFLVHFVPLLPDRISGHPLTSLLFINFFSCWRARTGHIMPDVTSQVQKRGKQSPQPTASAVTNAAQCLLCLALIHAVAHS